MDKRVDLADEARVDVVHKAVDKALLFTRPVREGELCVCIFTLCYGAGVDAVLSQRLRYVELAKHLCLQHSIQLLHHSFQFVALLFWKDLCRRVCVA